MDKQFGLIRMTFISIIFCHSIQKGFSSPAISNTGSSKIPSYLKICSRSDPQLNECVKQSIEILRPKLSKGIPEMNIPSCDPFVIPELTFKEGRGSVNVKSQYKNITVRGASQFDLKRVSLDLDNDRIDFDLVLPRLATSSNYMLEGKILLLPISGTGRSYGNYSDVTASATVKGERVQRNGMAYFNVRDFDVHFNVGHASINMDNLFGGNRVAGEAMNTFLNNNWQSLFGEMRPLMEETVATIFKDISNEIFQRFPVNDLFKP